MTTEELIEKLELIQKLKCGTSTLEIKVQNRDANSINKV